MNKTTKGLIKHGAQYVVSTELVALGKRIKENNKRTKEIEKQKVEDPPAEKNYEYVFYEPAVYQINEIISGLIETLLLNGIEVDSELLNKAKEMIECVDWLLKDAERDRTNDSTM